MVLVRRGSCLDEVVVAPGVAAALITVAAPTKAKVPATLKPKRFRKDFDISAMVVPLSFDCPNAMPA